MKYPNVTVRLTEKEGNALGVIAAVGLALQQAEQRGDVPVGTADRWRLEALSQDSYDDLLRLAVRTIDVG